LLYYTYLEHCYASTVVLTVEQMEALLGFSLPALACTEPDWWASVGVRTNQYSDAYGGGADGNTPSNALFLNDEDIVCLHDRLVRDDRRGRVLGQPHRIGGDGRQPEGVPPLTASRAVPVGALADSKVRHA
jgi:hypothetical protein